METALRREKWPPTPRRPRRRQVAKNVPGVDQGKLEALFGQERAFCYPVPPVVLLNSGERGRREKWTFQGEILRAECKFLRMEKQITVKRLERERVFMETSLKSALDSLISARRKVGECGNVSSVLEEEIKELAMKLGELQKKTTSGVVKEKENLEKQATLLEKQLEEMNKECVVGVGEVVNASLTRQATKNGLGNQQNASNPGSSRFGDVENLTRKMERLSEGMEDEYGPMLSRTTNSLRYDFLHLSSLQEKKLYEQKICTGHCKFIVRRIMEQVRAETEQWSQMQEMLGQVRAEMEHLQVSRDFWEGRALDSDNKIHSLNAMVQEWKHKALSLEIEINEKQQENAVQEELERLRIHKGPKDLTPHPQEKEKEKEKRVLTCSVKGKILAQESCRKIRQVRKTVSHKGCSRQPFQDIGNLSPLCLQSL